ncbi:MAG: hypothetical protein BroJett011_07450 [Chloroflexota bacterium]|nr:MAG: hypothetical protein BroJett011_07450 [Chloroflexota bacterium]
MKEELLKAFGALAPKVYDSKISLENDKAAIAISSLLSEPQGLILVEYLSNELEHGKKPIYLASEFLSNEALSRLIEKFYRVREQESLQILLAYYNQIWVQGLDNPSGSYETLRKLAKSAATNSATVILKLCLDCALVLDNSLTECNGCSGKNLLEISQLTLAEQARAALRQGQFLEIYVKECLVQSGVELIGYQSSNRSPKGYIGVEYRVHGEPVEIDVHGIVQPLTILLSEVKTAQKITINDLRRVDSVFQGLAERVNKSSQLDIPCLKLFIITGEFDQNIPRKAYTRKSWELIDRTMIPGLAEELKRIQQEL